MARDRVVACAQLWLQVDRPKENRGSVPHPGRSPRSCHGNPGFRQLPEDPELHWAPASSKLEPHEKSTRGGGQARAQARVQRLLGAVLPCARASARLPRGCLRPACGVCWCPQACCSFRAVYGKIICTIHAPNTKLVIYSYLLLGGKKMYSYKNRFPNRG